MLDQLQSLEDRYNKLNELLSDPEIINDTNKLREYSKEQSGLEDTVTAYREYKEVLEELSGAEEMLADESDPEMAEMAKLEVDELTERRDTLEEDIRILLLPKDPNDEKNVIIEAHTTGVGGYKEIIFTINGTGVYSNLKFENGAHRVQRVPETESGGRIHTSTATVAVLPEAEEVEVDVHDKDIRVDTFASSGPGGQSVNTTMSAVRLTHEPTGIVVSCQDEKSQIKNKEKAMKVLRARIYDKFQQEARAEYDETRKSAVGTGDRSERIRTYNFPQNRVTDHRIGLTIQKLDQILEGKLEEFIDALILEEQTERMKEIGE